MTPYPPLLLRGNSLVELRRIPDDSVDSIVTDPPYGLANTDPAHVVEALTRWAQGERDFIPEGKGFMGKAWDAFVPPPAVWDECMRILKPGGHLLAFAGSRTFDLMTLSIRFAGFDIRDSIAWLYGSGFPKSLDVSKAIDKAAGAERTQVVGSKLGRPGMAKDGSNQSFDSSSVYGQGDILATDLLAPATEAAREWEGWGTALKPAFEPIVVARKPLIGTVAANVLAHGTGALNIDESRIGSSEALVRPSISRDNNEVLGKGLGAGVQIEPSGRWPANVILDESQAAELDAQAPKAGASGRASGPSLTGESTSVARGQFNGLERPATFHADGQGGASRFFYVAKAPKAERPSYWRPSCNCETVKPCEEQSPQRAIDESKSVDDRSWNMSTSGKKQKGGKSRPDTIFTTETATSSTTNEATFNLSPSSSTSASTLDANSEMANGGSHAVFVDASSQSLSSTGTSRHKDGHSTAAADPAILSEWFETSVCAKCGASAKRESHATVKPLALMRWLVTLVTPPGGVVVDPFAGSGTTLEAAYQAGMESIGIELTPDYWPLIEARIERATSA